MKTKLMRKLVLATAVVCAAVGARAEMLWWSATGIESSPGNKSGDTLSGANQYLAYIFADTGSGPTTGNYKANMFTTSANPITSYSTIMELLAKGEDISSYAFYNATTTVRTYTKDKGRLNSYSDGTASYNDRVGWIGKYGVVNLFAVILDGTTFENSEHYMIATTTDGKQVLTQETTNNQDYYSKGMTDVYFDWGSQKGNTWYKIGTVPEPTSGLLLLVGVAALALRRKHAA